MILIAIGLTISSQAQTKIGFYTLDDFDISGNSVAQYGMSSIRVGSNHYVGLSGYFGLNFYTNGTERIKLLRDGKVGIGTSTPSYLLDVSGDVRINENKYLRFGANQWAIQQTGGNLNFLEVGKSDGVLFMKSGGNIGIGTTNPDAALDVKGMVSIGKTYKNVIKVGPFAPNTSYFYIDTKIAFNDIAAPQLKIQGYNYGNTNKAIELTLGWYVYNNKFYWSQYKNNLGYYNPSRIRLGTYDDNGIKRVRIEIANDGTYWSSYFISATDHNGITSNYNNWVSTKGQMPVNTGDIVEVKEHSGIVYSNIGNVGIGTTNPGSWKLAVNGNIRAKEIKVETGWSDFVFYDDYKLPTLEEVENYIKEKGHLKDIPSAKEVEKDGIFLGEMDSKLLQKIEELTLYTINQEKKIKALEKQNAKIEKQKIKLEKQQKEIDELKTLVNQLMNKKK